MWASNIKSVRKETEGVTGGSSRPRERKRERDAEGN